MSVAEAPEALAAPVRRRSARRGVPSSLGVAAALLGLLVLIAIVAPLIDGRDPQQANIAESLLAPSWAHPMGTDSSGRDVLARFAAGARISLLSGLAVVAIGGVIGVPIGVAAGTARGLLDGALMRAMDAIVAFPALILAMAVSIALGAGLTSAVIGIALTTVPFYARLMRADVRRIRALPHVEAARAVGVPSGAIVRRHVLPHALPTLLMQSAAVFGFAILTLAGLGFVGLGAQIPMPEWGAMITEGQEQVATGQWWPAFFPGLGVLIAVVAANAAADGLRARLDPRGAG